MEMIHISVVERPNTFSCSRGCTVGMAGSRSSPRAHPYRKSEPRTHQGAVMWVGRVVSSAKLKERVLETLHEGLVGMVRIKVIFRGYVWWPNLDKDIKGQSKTVEDVGRQQIIQPTQPYSVGSTLQYPGRDFSHILLNPFRERWLWW